MNEVGLNLQKAITPEKERFCESFLRIQYPLSDLGTGLKQRIIDGLEVDSSELPTVENPRPELFAELGLSNEDKKIFFGEKLSNIQTTKGCRHQCTFCAAGAAKKVETMPFPAVVKIAEEKKRQEEEILNQPEAMIRAETSRLLMLWQEDIQKVTGYSLDEIRKIKHISRDRSTLSPDQQEDIRRKIIELFKQHELYAFLKIHNKDFVRDFDNLVRDLSWALNTRETAGTITVFVYTVPVDDSDIFYHHRGWKFSQSITTYFDSDPFDYRDLNFLHSDGTPADYGDVFKLLASEGRPIHITTAGWAKSDKIAQSAARKIVEMGPGYTFKARLSVNPYEARARKNIQAYFEDTINTIESLAPLGLEILFFNDQVENRPYDEMCAEIKRRFNDDERIILPRIAFKVSAYSGHIKDERHQEDHHDVMACMPGYHVWPDGTVANQESILVGKSSTVLKGTRPVPTGKKMW